MAPIDESAMEDLFREILAPSPLLSATPLPIGAPSEVVPARPTSTAGLTQVPEPMIDWEGEAEMQRLLDMLPDVAQDTTTDASALDADDFPGVLELGLPGWDLSSPSMVSAF